MVARKTANVFLCLAVAAIASQGGSTAAVEPQAPAPPPRPEVRRVVDLRTPGEPVYLDPERPVAIDLRALIPNGRYRSRSIFPGRGAGWMIHPGFNLREPSASFGEPCVARYRALRAAFDAPDAAEAVRLREVFKAGRAQSGCPQFEEMMEDLAKGLTPQLAYGLEPPDPRDPQAQAPMKLQIERLDEAGNVLKVYEWPILRPSVLAVTTESEWIASEVVKRVSALVGKEGRPELDPAQGVWTPATYVPFARTLGVGRARAAPVVFSNDMVKALTTPTIETLLVVNKELALALRSDRLNPVTHEAAALLLVATALRPGVSGLEDVRPLLNRAVAHLTLASAARPRLGIEGELASAGIEALTGRQVAASRRLERSKARRGSAPARAWYRALMMRASGDWRLYRPTSRPNLLEQTEHARALVRSWSPARAAEFRRREGLYLNTPGWGRVILRHATVELGNELATLHLGAEFDEAARLAEYFGAPDLPTWLQAASNEAPLDPIPEVLWARLAEGSVADGALRFHKYLEGGPPSAASEEFRSRMAADFPQSPVVQALAQKWRGENPETQIPDRCDDLATWIKTDAFRLNARGWEFARQGCQRLGRSFPLMAPRFTPWTPAGTLFDFTDRVELTGLAPEVMKADWPAYRRMTFYEPTVLGFAVGYAEQREPGASDYRRFTRERSYSLSLLRDWRFVTSSRGDVRESLEPGRAACGLDAEECVNLIDVLRSEGHGEEAYSTAMRVFGPGREISVSASNGTAWIIDENVRRRKLSVAQDIARRAAQTGSYVGLLVQARLVERMSDYEQAKHLYAELDQAYNGKTSSTYALRGLARQGRAREDIVAALKAIGEPSTLMLSSGEMVPGLIVGTQWLDQIGPVRRAETRRMNLPIGGVITAVNGFPIANEAQFWAVLSLNDNEIIDVTLRSEAPQPMSVRGQFSRALYGPIGPRP